MIRIGMDPDMFRIGNLILTWHGFFAFVAVALAVVLTARFARREGMDPDTIYSVAVWAIIGGIVGARLFHVIDRWDFYSQYPLQLFTLWSGGIAIWGAVLGGFVGGAIYCSIKKLPTGRIADITAPALLLAMAVGRIGDIINGEHFAEPTGLPWGVRYTHPESPSFQRYGPDHVQHPAVAYEMLADLAIFAVLLWLFPRTRPGVTFFAWAALYSAMRLGISFLRLDDIVWAGLRSAQIIAIAVLAISVPALVYLLWRRERPQPRAERRRLIRAMRRRLARGGQA